MKQTNNKKTFVLIAIVYLLGIFMGAIDTGIVTPARTVIQNSLFVNDKTGIWMITIYTLAYAASIPIMGKLADKYGRKYIYLFSILLFGLGSLFCGLSQNFGSFTVLLIARAVQAIGGGGIVPVATAEFGTTFPKEKRGMALGLVGGVYGIANIFGASAGSTILDLFGKDNWQYIFYINLPITLFIIIAGIVVLPNSKATETKKIDFIGITILTLMILSLLYGLRNIDFFDFTTTIISTSVYPFLICFIILIPFFIFAEKKAEDPVMNLNYFTNPRIIITLLIAFLTGVVIMGMIFVPQFSENALKISSGSGGYFVIILGVFAGIGAPFSGKLIDYFSEKYGSSNGAKIILGFGFAMSIIGSLFLILITSNYPNIVTVGISLMLIGLGIGFTMGTPLNYMMLDNTKSEESNSALATLSLVRSIGTTIAPAIMIGFIAHAGINVQTNVMNLIPTEIEMPKLPYLEELSAQIEELKQNPSMSEALADVELPDLDTMKTIEINMSENSEVEIPAETLALLQSSDITTITQNCIMFADEMFDKMTPNVVLNIQSGIQSGIDGMNSELAELTISISDMQMAISGIDQSLMRAIPGDEVYSENEDKKTELLMAVQGMTIAQENITETIEKMTVLKESIPDAFESAKLSYADTINSKSSEIEKTFQTTLGKGFQQVYLTVVIASFIGIIILIFYKNKKEEK